MAYYRSVGDVPPKRHTQHRDARRHLYREELMGEEGFSSDSSLLYHRGVPSAIVDTRSGSCPTRPAPPTTPSSRATSSSTTCSRTRHRRGHRPSAGARQRRRPDRLRRDRRPTPRRTTATPSATSACTSSPAPAPSRRSSGCCATATGDYVVIPRATTHRWVPGDAPSRLYAIEATATSHPPKRYLSRYGQLLEHAPYCERDLHGPDAPLLVADRRRRRRGAGQAPRPARGIVGTRMTYATHPFDVVGWDGCLYPYTFNIEDFDADHRQVHQPPPVHQVFEGRNFVICNFCPRKVDYHPQAIPVPYYHSNVDSDEVMFYVGGDYEARKGSGIEHRLDLAAPGRPRPRPAARGDRGLAGCGVLRRAGGHGRHLRARSSSARAAWRSRTRRTPGPGPAGAPTVATALRSSRTRDRHPGWMMG